MSSVATDASAGTAVPVRRSARRTGLIFGLLLVVAAGGSAWLAVRAQRVHEDLPVLATVPDFALTEASGRTVTRQDLAGRPWVVDLVFTHCAGICPTMTAAMSRLVQSTTALPDLRFVSISVDPQNDTPEVLTAYAERFQADRTRWLFLTGDQDAVRKLAVGGLKLPLADGDPAQGEDAILHSQRFVLVDAQSQVRGTYDVRDQEAMFRLRADLERLSTSDRG